MRDALSARDIRTTKANDMCGVFTPTIRDYSALVACASSVLVIIAFVFSAVPDAERMAREKQEVHVKW